MAYNFTISSNSLIVTLDTESGKLEPDIQEYFKPNIFLGNDRILLKEESLFSQEFVFSKIGNIGGQNAVNLIDAYQLLDALIKSIFVAGGSGGVQSVTGDYVSNSNPLNPVISIPNANSNFRGLMSNIDFKKLNNLPSYANNTSAISAGLAQGSFYRTGDFVKVVNEDF